MAASSYLKSLFGALPADLKVALSRAAEYLLDGNLRFGPIAHQVRTENFAGVYLVATTHVNANTEFSVLHGLGLAPTVVMPVLNPQTVNSQLLSLTVSRAADPSRLYFTSASTNVTFALYVER